MARENKSSSPSKPTGPLSQRISAWSEVRQAVANNYKPPAQFNPASVPELERLLGVKISLKE